MYAAPAAAAGELGTAHVAAVAAGRDDAHAPTGGTETSRRTVMTLCPIALLVGCKKCAVFAICPLKSVIGDYGKPEDAPSKPNAGKEPGGPKPAK